MKYQSKLGLSNRFFELCREKAGKSKRYLTKEMTHGKYNSIWGLVVPDNMYNLKNGVLDDRIQ